MRRLSIFASLALAAGCLDTTPPGPQPFARLSPLLDSLFVGDTTPPVMVTYYNAAGEPAPVGAVTWGSDNPAIATVDGSGRVAGVGRGQTRIRATTNGVTGLALVVVTRDLQVTLLLDTIYLLAGDNSFTVPVEVRRKGGSAPAPWFETTSPFFSIDSATGRVTAVANGGPSSFVVHADTVADTGAVHVLFLPDPATGDGRGYYTLFGTVTLSENAMARALHVTRTNNTQAFRLSMTIPPGGSPVEEVIVMLLDSITDPRTFFIDSLSRSEGGDFLCAPPRSWGFWSSGRLELSAVSRSGIIAITQMDTVSGRVVVGGRFEFEAQRVDFYEDLGGRIPIRGTFVAPLVSNPCRSN